ncbi:MAG: hypothetical protein H7Y22_15415 [Gemmatimonadaceae bacterium]|nr:hypothetical protein [Gloeobacterales cyanobacterium ES-bin-141]
MEDQELFRGRVEKIRAQRGDLVELLERPDLGTMRQDVSQALEEIDELLTEFERTFPDA